MTDLDRQKRPALAVRRASGTSTRIDRGANLGPTTQPLSERLNRADDHSTIDGSSLRSPSFSTIRGMSKLTRSTSSHTPASLDSRDSSRSHSVRSISGSVETAAYPGTTTSTASPVVTPADDLLLDPLLSASKRSLTASPLLFEPNNSSETISASSPALSAQHRDTMTTGSTEDHRMGVKQRRSDAAGAAAAAAASSAASTTIGFRPAAKRNDWTKTNTALRWMDTSSLASSPPLSTPASQSTSVVNSQDSTKLGAKSRREDKMTQDLVTLTHSMSINGPPTPSTAATQRPDEGQAHAQAQAAEQQQQQQQNHYLQLQSGLQQDQSVYHGSSPRHMPQQTFPQHTPFLHRQQAQYYTSVDTMQSPGLYSSASFQQSPVSATGPMDPTPFEMLPSTPDPYATMYGLPGPASLASSSSPQSPRFTHQGHQGSDSSMFMYPNTYPHGMPGLTHQGLVRTGPPGGTPGPIISPNTAASASHNAMIMQGMSPFPPQSPMLMSMAPSPMDRFTRRDSLSYHQQAPLAIPAGNYSMGSQWATPPPGPGSAGGGFMHSHTPSWPGGFEYRTSSGMGHQRVLSGHQPFSPPGMTFIPGSMSPPSSFTRPAGGGRMGMHSRTTSNFSQFSQQRSPQSEVHRSPLLEEFRARHNKSRRFELQDVRGYIVEFSSDQHGSRFTQEKLDTASAEDLKMVFDELLPSALGLMTDVFGNYVIQKLFEHGTTEMRLQLMNQMQGHILSLSLGTYGCRVVQKALEYVGNEDQMRIADELRRDALTCVRDQNANHVVQKILECISPTMQVDFIPQTFRNHVYSLAAHCYSCRVLQRIFEHCEDSQRRPLIDELLRESEKLMHDQYGNYVIQWILQHGSKPDRDLVIGKARGNVLVLSRHKFASNVVEQVIRAASPEERCALIEEIIAPVDGTNASVGEEAVEGAVVMMKDQYGNYVLQRFLEMSQGQQRARLVALVKPALYNMKRFSSGYTKHLAAIERLLESGSSSPRDTPPVTMTSKSIMTGDGTSGSTM